MKFEPSTIDVLKNFAAINPMLLFREGSTLKTRSKARTLAARATLKQSIPRTFAVLDVGRFLDTVALFQDPEIKLGESFFTIKQGSQAVRYVYAAECAIRPNDGNWECKLPSEYVSFTLRATDYVTFRKGVSALSLPAIAIVGDGQKLSLQALDTHDKAGDVFSLVIGSTEKTFKAVISAENLKIVPLDYQVSISDKGVAHLKSVDGTMEYWAALLTTDSKFVPG